jgi:hypothetical protein
MTELITKRIRKSTIIKALQTEPLGADGQYIARVEAPSVSAEELGWGAEPSDKECLVCAVGAILRYTGITKAGQLQATGSRNTWYPTFTDAPTWAEAKKKAKELIKSDPDEALSALSSLYEAGIDNKVRLAVIRKNLVSFVEKNFPKTIAVEIEVW